MKKLLSFLLTFMLVISVMPLGAFTLDVSAATSGYYTYSVSGGKAKITDVNTSISGDITIPDTLGGYPVTSIGNLAFCDCTRLTSITIGGGVTSIGERAFGDCHSLTSITIPDSVTSIGDDAFYYCTSLTCITIPDSVTSIGERAFRDCTNLTAINVDEENKNYCDIDSVLFNKDVTTLVQYPAGKTNTSYIIPDSVTIIGGYAFYYCTRLTSITIGGSVTSIGDRAFLDCTSLTSITIPDSVTSIGDWAFGECTSLTSITIPHGVTSIGWSAFRDCTNLTAINVDEENKNYCDIDSVLFNKAVTTLIQYPIGNTNSTYTIPDSVTSIGDWAFSNCDSLTSITIPGSVTSIDELAFYYCTSLTSITIGGSVTSIGLGAFEYCTRLTSITIPDSVASIGYSAFSNCDSLKDVYYRGAQEDKNSISIEQYNNDLLNATWHYNSCIGETEHVYDNACDTNCNECGFMRTVPDHIYDNACDTNCNICVAIRTVLDHVYTSDCDRDCNECGFARVVPDHIYDNVCDTNCNICDAVRAVPDHVYDNACDTNCNECGFARTVPDHVYDNDCDSDCNVCGAIRTIEHTYSNVCDIDCNVCGFIRTVDHVFTDACDGECDICFDTRKPPHNYDNACDAVCNLCGKERAVIGHNESAPVEENRIEPTCTEEGSYDSVVYCTVCGEELSRETVIIPATGHICNLDGRCFVCGWHIDDPIGPPPSHTEADPVEENRIEPTCTVDGSYDSVVRCTVCGEELSRETTVLPALGHTYGDTTVVEPAYKQEGYSVHTCLVCGYEERFDFTDALTYMSGDMNGDEAVNNRDLGILMRYLNGWDIEFNSLSADVNRDGLVNNRDYGVFMRYLNGWDVELN